MVRYVLSRIVFLKVLLLGKLVGISYVVGYLRNPNPLATIQLLRAFGAEIGEGTTVKRAVLIDNAYEDENSSGDFRYLRIGKNCYIGDAVYLDLANRITFGDNVVISGQVSIITHADCNRSECLNRIFPRQCASVTIGNGAWLGFRTTILHGVTVGENTLIAAHALLRDNADSRSVYTGVPARKIRELQA
jgi:putative colanic acid biosynthesis acetyltransferase WcaF